jgi:hypothetical protein
MTTYLVNSDLAKRIEPKWTIKGFPEYFVGEDKKIYRIKTGRAIKKTLVNYTIGYYLHGKFYSLTKLRSLLEKVNS